MTGPTPKAALVPLRGTPDVVMHDRQRQRLYVFAPRSGGALVFREAA